MATKEDFNAKAMEEKIAENIKKGFTIETILKELLSEQVDLLKKMGICEARIVELEDQVQYIRGKYGIGADRIQP